MFSGGIEMLKSLTQFTRMFHFCTHCLYLFFISIPIFFRKKKKKKCIQPSQLGKEFDSKFLPSIFASSKAFRQQKFSCLFLLAARVHD